MINILMLLAAANPALSTAFSQIVPIPLHPGINRIASFADDGRTALIARAWRDNGNAHGYSLFTVMMERQSSPHDWNIVGVDHSENFSDAISDDPHTGEDVVSAVRFVRAFYQGRRQTLLLIASRRWKASIPDPAPTTIEVYGLRKSQGDVGETQDYFSRILTAQGRRNYCNADMALHQEAGLPLPADYSGSSAQTGC